MTAQYNHAFPILTLRNLVYTVPQKNCAVFYGFHKGAAMVSQCNCDDQIMALRSGITAEQTFTAAQKSKRGDNVP